MTEADTKTLIPPDTEHVSLEDPDVSVSRKWNKSASNVSCDSNNNNNVTDSRKPDPPRNVVRNLPFHQSKNVVAIDHNKGLQIGTLVQHDLYHVLLRRKLYVSLSILLLIWSVGVVLFAGLYLIAENNAGGGVCALFVAPGTFSYHGAFAFSLQTCTTVGYTLPSGSDAFFQNCPALQSLMYLQSVWSMLFNAFLIAFIYSRVSRAEQRSVQVLFTDKAIVSLTQEPHPQVNFQVRVYDVDAKHPVVEARTRMYAVLKDRPVPKLLRLIQPNDELGSPLLLSIPTLIVHHLDIYSALHPPTEFPVSPAGLTLRVADSSISSREEVVCPVCGESYGTHQRWVNHVETQLRNEIQYNYPVEGTHRSIPESHLQAPLPPDATTLEQLRDYFQQEVAEVIVIVSGQDPLTSGSFHAMQSYCFDDIVWHPTAAFQPCITTTTDKNHTTEAKELCIDLDSFHQVDTVPTSATPASRTVPAQIETESLTTTTTTSNSRRRREPPLLNNRSRRTADGFLLFS